MAGERSEHLTEAQKKQLEAELAELEGPRRAEAVEAIANARSFGDLSENFEYHSAKNEQGLLERRITILRDRLERAVLIDERQVRHNCSRHHAARRRHPHRGSAVSRPDRHILEPTPAVSDDESCRDSIADAQRNTMRDVNSVSWRVTALITRTPRARDCLGS